MNLPRFELRPGAGPLCRGPSRSHQPLPSACSPAGPVGLLLRGPGWARGMASGRKSSFQGGGVLWGTGRSLSGPEGCSAASSRRTWPEKCRGEAPAATGTRLSRDAPLRSVTVHSAAARHSSCGTIRSPSPAPARRAPHNPGSTFVPTTESVTEPQPRCPFMGSSLREGVWIPPLPAWLRAQAKLLPW